MGEIYYARDLLESAQNPNASEPGSLTRTTRLFLFIFLDILLILYMP